MIRSLAITAVLSAVLGAGGAWWVLSDLYVAKTDLVEAQAALDAALAEVATANAAREIAESRATVADFAFRQVTRIHERDLARMEAMEDLIDDIEQSDGAGDPVPDVLRRVIELR